MRGDDNRWQQFNLIIDNETLNIKEKGLLLILFRYINYKTGYADPSRVLIKKLTKISDNRTLDNILKSLENKGFLKRKGGSITGIRTKYYINIPGTQIEPGGEITPGGKITINQVEKLQKPGGKITPQKEKKRKIKENNIYSVIFNFWISKDIKKHRSLSPGIKKSIDKALKDFSKDEILEAINNYSEVLKSDYYFSYVWGLDEFLVRTDKDRIRQLPKFLNDGSTYMDYISWRDKNKLLSNNTIKPTVRLKTTNFD